MKKQVGIVIAVVACMLGCFAASVPAGEYPEKPITLMVGFGGGGLTDISIRMLTNLAQKDFATPIIVTPKPGGTSTLMHGLIAQSTPDGYNLGVLMTAALSRIPHLKKVPYNPLKDFTPIMQYASYQYGLVVKADSEFKTLKDFINYAKKNPGKVTYATSGAGSGQHLVMEYLALKEGIKWVHIPTKGGIAAVTACLGGHVTACPGPPDWKPYVESGQLRLLASFGEQRIDSYPDVETIQEMGYDMSTSAGIGIVGPKGMPKEVVDKIYKSFSEASQQPGFQKLLKRLSLLPLNRNQDELTSFINKEYEQKKKIIEEAGLGLYQK